MLGRKKNQNNDADNFNMPEFSIPELDNKFNNGNKEMNMDGSMNQGNMGESASNNFSSISVDISAINKNLVPRYPNFIIGQTVEAFILGALCTIGMIILGLPYAPMVGSLVGITAFIPIIGAFIGGAIGAFMIFTVDYMQAFIFIIFLVILQQLEGDLIYPRVVGSTIGLPSIWVLFAVTVGGSLWGITGVLLGVPIVSVIYSLVKIQVKNREKRLKVKENVEVIE